METLRDQFRAGSTSLGGWLSIPHGLSAELMARAGVDYVCIDMQHGAIDYSDVPPLIQAILLADVTPIVRVPWNEPGIIGKVLDAGAHGVIIPMVNSVEEAEAAVRACRYAPAGSRSSGPILAQPRVDGSYVDWAAEHVACIPMIETTQAVAALDDILAVSGIDAIYVGPSDLSITLGLGPGNNDGEPSFDEALQTIADTAARHDIPAGIHSTGGLTPKHIATGYRMITVTSDSVALRVGIDVEMEKARTGDGSDTSGAIY